MTLIEVVQIAAMLLANGRRHRSQGATVNMAFGQMKSAK
jgi:hypothetical protein